MIPKGTDATERKQRDHLLSRGRKMLARGRRALRSVAAQHPILYYPVEWLVRPRHRPIMVDARTDLVIEGYPRSANSFTVAAFRFAQPRSYRLAHHLHVSAQVVRAARLGIPTLVLIRAPEAAIISRAIFTPDAPLSALIRDYYRFYERVERFREAFVLVDFQDAISDLGAVLEGVNQRFHTHFTPFQHTPENVERVFASLEERAVLNQGRVDEHRIARPSAERQARKAQIASALALPNHADLLTRARVVYGRLTAR